MQLNYFLKKLRPITN